MDIQLRQAGGIRILDFSGNLDTNNSLTAETEVNRLIGEGSDRLLFNFGNLNFIASSGLRVLLSTAKQLKASGGRMVICNLNATVQDLFEISGFATILNLATDDDEALASF